MIKDINYFSLPAEHNVEVLFMMQVNYPTKSTWFYAYAAKENCESPYCVAIFTIKPKP